MSKRSTAPNLIITLGALSALIGAWFWQKENAFATQTDNELASILQWVGVGLVLVGVALVSIGVQLKKIGPRPLMVKKSRPISRIGYRQRSSRGIPLRVIQRKPNHAFCCLRALSTISIISCMVQSGPTNCPFA